MAKQQDHAAEPVEPFKLFLVEKSLPPDDGMPGTWFRYEITQGDNVIMGLRQGSRTAVTQELKETVAALNERRQGRRGRVNLAPAAPSTKRR